MLQRLAYYVCSIPTILGGIKNWPMCLSLLWRKRPVIITLRNGCQFKVRSLMDVWIIKETCLDHDYEVNATAIQAGWTVVDIGAGLGDFTLAVAYAHPHCQVYAYEPFPESYALLEENVSLNAIGKVKAFPIAVGAYSGDMTLLETGAAVQHTTTRATVPSGGISVAAVCLDEVLVDNAILQCDFLKIDCEGGEFDILFNVSDATLNKIKHICLEYHNGVTEFSHTDLVDYLQGKGFQVQVIPNPVHRDLGFLYAHWGTLSGKFNDDEYTSMGR